MSALADLATETGTVVVLVSAIGGFATRYGGRYARRWLEDQFNRVSAEQAKTAKNTEQLVHNGGSHVADYARDARDISQKTLDAVAANNERLTAHLIEAAEQRGAVNAQLAMLQGK